uniref:Coiled-coil domain-containing protein n=1 Tax=Glycine max TaxID=3847 RepID=A0A0R0K908_SOYBN
MPKKMGVNTKAEAARARKSAADTERKEKESREKEDQYWREAEGSKSRAAKKKEEEAEKRAEAERKAEEAKKQQSRTAAEEEYERMVLISNTNRDDSIIEARTLDDAIAQMTVVDNLPPDRHPERRLKASFKAFEEAELPKLKEEKPGLTHTQYKDMIWKLWKKSPDNPLNQIAE